jgi:hypothetical protein
MKRRLLFLFIGMATLGPMIGCLYPERDHRREQRPEHRRDRDQGERRDRDHDERHGQNSVSGSAR